MLDGKRLAARLEGVLDNIGAYQRAGKVADFWPYFRAGVDRYVGATPRKSSGRRAPSAHSWAS